MVAWVHEEEGLWRPRSRPIRPQGLPLLEAALPPGRPGRGARLLARQGIRRVLADGELAQRLAAGGFFPVSPLPLYRALGDRLCLELLKGVPLRERKVVLRGGGADVTARALAEALCPRVGELVLDFDRGGEALGRRLQGLCGGPFFGAEWAGGARGILELSPVAGPPRPAPEGGRLLRLWGGPELAGLTLTWPGDLPEGLPLHPFLQLLWEAGRLEPGEVEIGGG